MIPLHLLPAGETARIAEVFGHPEFVHRLDEMGLRVGTQIEMVKAGSPCIVRLDDQRLCFRPEDCSGILVTPAVMA